MGIRKRLYTEEDYFNFLYDLAFRDDDYILLAKLLHEIEYVPYLRMDENRIDDGYEIRKYYLADKNGYLPDYIDTDDIIFPEHPSVLEVWVGFSNKICRDMSRDLEIWGLIRMFCENLGILVENWGIGEERENIINTVKMWMSGDFNLNIFGELGNFDENCADLWSQASLWLYEE